MTYSIMRPEMTSACKDLIEELSTEIDLHYESDELPDAKQAIEKLKTLAFFVSQTGASLPSYTHIVDRFEKSLRN